MRRIVFLPNAFDEYNELSETNGKLRKRVCKIVKEVARAPFEGIGKPEPLKYTLKDCWSRRITQEHRLVYQVTDEAIVIISCKYHY